MSLLYFVAIRCFMSEMAGSLPLPLKSRAIQMPHGRKERLKLRSTASWARKSSNADAMPGPTETGLDGPSLQKTCQTGCGLLHHNPTRSSRSHKHPSVREEECSHPV